MLLTRDVKGKICHMLEALTVVQIMIKSLNHFVDCNVLLV